MATIKQTNTTTKKKRKVKIKYVKKCANCGKFAKQVYMFDFTKSEYDKICEELMLNDEYKKLLEMKIKGYTRTKMALELKVSEPTLDVMIKKLKKKITKIL